MDRLFRSNSSISFRTSIPLDIINDDDHTVEETNLLDLQKWNIPKVEPMSIYRTSWTENPFVLNTNSELLNKHILFQKLMKNVDYFPKEMISLLKNSVIYILALFKSLVNLLLEKVLTLLVLCV